jgi:protein FrlC
MNPLPMERFAMGSYQYLRYPLEYVLDTAQELGFSQVELWAASPHLYPDALTKEARHKVKQALARRRLHPCVLTPEQVAYPFNLAAKERKMRYLSIGYYRAVIDLASELEAPNVLVTAGCGYFNEPVELAWDRSLQSVGELALYAQHMGISLLYETLTPASSNILNTPEQMHRMLSALPDNVGGIADLGQIAHMDQDLSDYIKLLGKRLRHIHLHDYGDAIHMALGEGCLPIKKIIQALEQSGYTGLYAFEINDPRYRADPIAADQKSLYYLRKGGILS